MEVVGELETLASVSELVPLLRGRVEQTGPAAKEKKGA
jgi:hypothetical protein